MNGYLVIAGGNVENTDIYNEFVKLAGGDDASIAIIPTASEDAKGTLKIYTDIFEKCGISREKIIGIKIDADNENNDGWKRTGDEYDSFEFLNGVKGVWFTGGDQVRIIKGFLRSDGSETILLKKIKDMLNSGGVVGGSSAGAAIMSEVMVGGGTSIGALTKPFYYDFVEYRNIPEIEEKGILLIMKGLGFFKCGVIDQHFDKRKRIGRLLETMFAEEIKRGYGISEDTALVYDIEKGIMRVVGTSGVTFIDTSDAVRTKMDNYSRIYNVNVSYIKCNDYYDINENKFYIADSSKEDQNTGSNRIISLLLNQNIDNYHKQYEDIGYELRLYDKQDCTKGSLKGNSSYANAFLDIVPVVLKAGDLAEAVK